MLSLIKIVSSYEARAEGIKVNLRFGYVKIQSPFEEFAFICNAFVTIKIILTLFTDEFWSSLNIYEGFDMDIYISTHK